MSNYTPGPWVVKGQSIKAIDHSLYFSIASAKSTKLTTEGNLANARLIAAAPDLLDALQRVMRHIPDNAGGASLSDDMHRAKKAIEKATGA